jgi:hypothetical protein
VNIYVEPAVQALRVNETQDETQFTTKISGNTSLGPSYVFDALLCRNWPFSPHNRLTLRITVIY